MSDLSVRERTVYFGPWLAPIYETVEEPWLLVRKKIHCSLSIDKPDQSLFIPSRRNLTFSPHTHSTPDPFAHILRYKSKKRS